MSQKQEYDWLTNPWNGKFTKKKQTMQLTL